jgi:peptidoglycan/LPS O-acetylase OafA/YrhL
VLALVLLINRWQDYTIASVAGASLLNLGVAVLVHRSAVHHRDLLGRLLNARPLVVVGGLSYSLYLWQQPFLDRASSAWSAAWPQNLVLAVTVALASYYLLEKPLLRLRRGLRSAPSTREAPALRGQRSGSSLGPRAPVGASADASQSAN